MKVAIITPSYFPSVRGNSITVQRIASWLFDQGLEVEVFSLERYREGLAPLYPQLRALRPDLLHGFNASRSGGIVVEVAEELQVPSVITATGTDVNHDLFHPERRPFILDVLRKADAIVVFHEVIKQKIVAEVPEVQGKIRVIKQTVRCEEKRYDLRGKLEFREGDVVFLLPAGIRRVKNVTFCVKPLADLQRRHSQVRLVFVGPIIEEEEGRKLLTVLEDLPWAFYLGSVSHEELCAMLHEVDVVLNTSISEGGMANAILEAMSRGVPVLASDIEGNRSVIRDGIDGLLFASEEEFVQKAEALIVDKRLRRRLGKTAKERIKREFPPEEEIQEYLALYQGLVRKAG